MCTGDLEHLLEVVSAPFSVEKEPQKNDHPPHVTSGQFHLK